MGFPLMGTHGELTRMRMGATRLNMPLDEYIAKRQAGLRWCFGHQDWEPTANFGPHSRRADGLDSQCIETRNADARERNRRRFERDPEAFRKADAEYQRRRRARNSGRRTA